MLRIRFKKGDKVIVKGKSTSLSYGQYMLDSIGTVLNNSSVPYVEFPNGKVCCFAQHKLEFFDDTEHIRESRVETYIRIKFPLVSPRGQQYMSLERSEAIEVYEDLKRVLGL